MRAGPQVPGTTPVGGVVQQVRDRAAFVLRVGGMASADPLGDETARHPRELEAHSQPIRRRHSPVHLHLHSRRLQAALAGAGIAYQHHRELAPTTELRHVQYAEDARQRVGKRSRVELAPEYARRYVVEILDHVDLDPIVATMPTDGTAALLCVEADPEACHRSLIAARLADEYDATVTHLRPNGQPK